MKPHFPSQILCLFFITVLLAVLAGAALPVQKTHAASITVNSTADTLANDSVCTLREAITNANNNAATWGDCTAGSGADTITFSVTGTITLTGNMPNISDNLTITGPGASSLTVSGAVGVYWRVFTVNSGVIVALSDLTIANGSHTSAGAGIHNSGSLSVTNVTLSNNSTSGAVNSRAGGIYNSGTLTVTNSTFSNNSTSSGTGGGAIFNATGGTVTISNSTFSSNSATNDLGGGIYNDAGGTLSVSNSTFSSNSAVAGGGGGINNSGTLTVTNSTFSSNTVTYAGGGILNDGSATVTNSTFSSNSAAQMVDGAGGGIKNGGTITITNTTFSGNSAGSGLYGGGGGLHNDSGTATLRNTIVANSTNGDCKIYGGTVTDGGNNIVEDNSCGFTGGSDPNLGTLQNNGGPTQTHALQSPSLAINAANPAYCPTADQRGYSRPDTCDIGSYEYNGSPTAVTLSSFTARTDADGNVLVVPGLALTGVIGVLAAGAMWWLRRARRA